MKIRYYGHIGQATGYGRAASDLCMAMKGAGVDLEIRPLSPPHQRVFEPAFLPLANHVKLEPELDPHPDVVIVHTLPVDCAYVQRVVMDGPTRTSAPWIAYTTWEAITRPAELRAQLYTFQQTWHPCAANIEALHGRTAARILPHCFDPTAARDRARSGTLSRDPSCFYFYYVGAWTERKNPGALVSAFHETFDPNENVHLVMQCANAPQGPVDRAREMLGTRVSIMTAHGTPAYVLEMHRMFDCFVTASKGEAWNLPCFDALLARRMIVAPFGLGSNDYLSGTDAALYDSIAGQLFLEPDIGMLQVAMRDVFQRRQRKLAVHYDLTARYGYPAVAQRAINYIAECYS